MGYAEQGRIAPVFASAAHEISALLAIEAAEGFVQNHEADATPVQGASEPNALSFAARDQPAVLSQVRLQTSRQLFQKLMQLRRFEQFRIRYGSRIRAEEEILEERSVPELHRGIDPGSLPTKFVQDLCVQWSPVYKDSAACRAVPTQQQAEQTGFTRAGWAHDCHMTTWRQFEIDLFQHHVTGDANADVLKTALTAVNGLFRELSSSLPERPPADKAFVLPMSSGALNGSSSRRVRLRSVGYCHATSAIS